jgi:hypothetical protein
MRRIQLSGKGMQHSEESAGCIHGGALPVDEST